MRRLLLTAILAALMAVPAVPADTVVIEAKKIYTADGSVLEPGHIVVTDGRITAMSAGPAADDANAIKVEVLIPGLVDAYSQAGLSQSAERTREVTPDLKTCGIIDFRDRDFAEAAYTAAAKEKGFLK